MKIVPLIFLWMTILDFLVVNDEVRSVVVKTTYKKIKLPKL